MRISLVSLVLALLLPARAHAAAIGLYGDAAGTDCNALVIPVLGSGTLYAIASVAELGGTQGAEFRIAGLPPGYIAIVTPNPTATVFYGDPFGIGCDIVFPECEGPQLLLFSALLLNQSDADDHVLQVLSRDPPGDPSFPCPLVLRCDPPVFTKFCVTGSQIGLVHHPRGEPFGPSPADGATDVSTGMLLRWDLRPSYCCTVGGLVQNLHFGTTPTPGIVAFDVHSPYDPGSLAPFTTYYWGIDSYWAGCISAQGPVWSFTTGALVQVESGTWARVKQLYVGP